MEILDESKKKYLGLFMSKNNKCFYTFQLGYFQGFYYDFL